MWELDCEESWVPKNWCFWSVVLEKTLESPLDCKEIQPVHSKGDQSWDFFRRNDAKAETPVLWPPHAKSWFIGKDWCWEGFGAGGEGDDRGWDGWMASLTRWTWVWVISESWWWTGRPGVLRFMGSQRVGQDWATELNWRNVSFKLPDAWNLKVLKKCTFKRKSYILPKGLFLVYHYIFLLPFSSCCKISFSKNCLQLFSWVSQFPVAHLGNQLAIIMIQAQRDKI